MWCLGLSIFLGSQATSNFVKGPKYDVLQFGTIPKPHLTSPECERQPSRNITGLEIKIFIQRLKVYLHEFSGNG